MYETVSLVFLFVFFFCQGGEKVVIKKASTVFAKPGQGEALN